MSDFENVLRSAVDRAAITTVTPSFGVVERRAQVRRRQQIAVVAAGITAVLAGGTLAVPRIDAHQLQPANDGRPPTTSYEQFLACLDEHRGPEPTPSPGTGIGTVIDRAVVEQCETRAGYRPVKINPRPSVSLLPTSDGVTPFFPSPSSQPTAGPIVSSPLTPPPPPDPTRGTSTCPGFTKHVDAVPVRGRTSNLDWQLVIEGPMGSDCELFMELLAREDGADDWKANNPEGGGIGDQDDVRWTTWQASLTEKLLGIWGSIDPDADYVEITVEGTKHRVDAVKQDGITKYTFMATMIPIEQPATPATWTIVAYDKNGNEVARYS